MSDKEPRDEEPTQILPAQGPHAPRDGQLPASVAPIGHPTNYGELPPSEPVRPSRALTVAVGIGVALLVILLLSVIGALIQRPGQVPPTPSPTPDEDVTVPAPTQTAPEDSGSAEPEPTQEVPAGPRITLFSGPATALCLNEEAAPTDITLSWDSVGATQAWIGVATADAQAAPYQEVAPTGELTLGFPCSISAQDYTLTVVGDGGKVSSTITVVRALTHTPDDSTGG